MTTVNEPGKTAAMQLVEHLFDSSLEDLLRGWYEQGASTEEMARRIAARGYSVSAVTVRAWIKNLNGRRTLVFPAEQQ